ncbi:MAG: carboxypeptidase-like regulatory domain-containing protein [Acidobacteriaceae bacterium]|nr:carboxypeptidase-like regulatory domain-containing protein [Acidobacteriaceae bacterium]
MKILVHQKTHATRRRGSRVVCLLAAVILLLAHRAFAQAANGSVSGSVSDASGALVPNAAVTLTDTSTNLSRSMKTNGEGIYSFANVSAGSYRLLIGKPGFSKTETTFNLEVAQLQRFDFRLRAGSADTVVEVNADSVTIETNTSDLGTVISQREVEDLPLDGRNVFALAALAPGVLPGGDFGIGLSTNRGAVIAAGANNFRANGGVAGMNEILLDGIPVTVCCQGQPALIPNADIVSQFKVQTNVPPANYGRSSGGF